MTIATHTAPISKDALGKIKVDLAEAIASSSVCLPEIGCDPMQLATVEASLNEEARRLLQQIPSANRQGDLAIAIVRAAELRKRSH